VDGPVRVGVDIVNGEKAILTLKPTGREELKKLIGTKSEAWRDLDVAVLHELLLKMVPGFVADQHKENIIYTKDVHEVITRMAPAVRGQKAPNAAWALSSAHAHRAGQDDCRRRREDAAQVHVLRAPSY